MPCLYHHHIPRFYSFSVEKSRRPEPAPKEAPSKAKMRPPSSAPKSDNVSYKTMSGSSQYRFGVLAKIVKHMKTRHQDGDDHPLNIEEILDETNQLDIGQSVKTVRTGFNALVL